LEFACLDLVNSDWHDHRGSGSRREYLDDRAWLTRFADKWGFSEAGEPDGTAVARLKYLRALLREMLEALAEGKRPSARQVSELNSVMGASPTVRVLQASGESYRLELVPKAKDWDWVAAEIAASFAEMVTKHDPTRVRVCANPVCHWVFYDESRNRTRRWCENTCANLLKVRRFRERRRNPKST
jgi:predicted RNA-binding Zn ribbon-like protein